MDLNNLIDLIAEQVAKELVEASKAITVAVRLWIAAASTLRQVKLRAKTWPYVLAGLRGLAAPVRLRDVGARFHETGAHQ